MHASDPYSTMPLARPAVRQLSASLIREVANAGLGLDDVLAFWFGEPDATTPAPVREAARAALADGETFYRHNLGDPALRSAIADYLSGLHRPIAAGRVAVTSAGVSALMVACQALLSPGDRVVAVVPLWPNLVAIPAILGATVERVAMRLDPAAGRWRLDLDRLLDAITPDTRLVILNSPCNPTGWVMPRADMAALLTHCRRTGTWVLSDEAYERLVFDGSRAAPSMLDVADPQDRLLVANTFSKTWLMTGWRLGWLVTPESVTDDIGKLIEYNTSCAPGFVQRAALVALRDGEPLVRDFTTGLRGRRDALIGALRTIPGVEVGEPDGAMYAFLRIAGQSDSLALAKALVRQQRLGLAPGAAFGPEGEGFLRWCFAKPVAQLLDGASRLRRFLESKP